MKITNKFNSITGILLLSCTPNNDTSESAMPVEIVSCTHPDSLYEAAVQVEIEDDISWSNVYFSISQDDFEWSTNLQTEDQFTWWTHMQLYELDCLSDFEFEVEYESR